MTEVIQGNLYDYPSYYDLVYGSDWKAEFDFIAGCLQQYGREDTSTLFEPACGTGRLLYRFGKAGFQVSGLDLNEPSIAYCNQRLERHELPPSAFVADMSDFSLDAPVDGAFNTVGSFRHLLSEEQSLSHLQCMARALRPGGIYLLGFHLTPTAVRPSESETWSARRGQLAVCVRQWLERRDLDAREEVFGMSYDVFTPSKQFQIRGDVRFRTYLRQDWEDLIEQVPDFEVAAIHDFQYELDEWTPLDDATEDVVFVLRKRL